MIGNEWKLEDVAETMAFIERHSRGLFLRPHPHIWPEEGERFPSIAGQIIDGLTDESRDGFLSACLASFLLDQEKAPRLFPDWFALHGSLDLLPGLTLDTLRACRWGRIAFILANPDKSGTARIVYAAAAVATEPLFASRLPARAVELMDAAAVRAVENAALLVEKVHHGKHCFLWPMLPPGSGARHIQGDSLGLPVYLAFLSLANGSAIPQDVLATGSVNEHGALRPVQFLDEKLRHASECRYKTFIYPLCDKLVAAAGDTEAKAAGTLREAEEIWRGTATPEALKRLQSVLKPTVFEPEADAAATEFIGRKWLIRQIEEWVTDGTGSNLLWISGSPGGGKTALAAWLWRNMGFSIAACHFCNFSYSASRGAADIVRALAYQLAARSPAYRHRLAELEFNPGEKENGADLFRKLFSIPLAEAFPAPGQTVVLLVDALDEAELTGDNDIVDILAREARRLPPWLRFLVTSRSDTRISPALRSYPCIEIEPELSFEEEDRKEISSYLLRAFPNTTESQRDQVIQRSQGVFLYIQQVCNDLREGILSFDRLEDFPSGLHDVYLKFFGRVPFGEVERLLQVLVAAKEPMTLESIRQLLKIEMRGDVDKTVKKLGALLKRVPSERDGQRVETVRPFHLSLVDWLTDPGRAGEYLVYREDGDRLFAAYGWELYEKNKERLPAYFLAWLPAHLEGSGREGDSASFLHDFSMMMARVKAGQLERMLSDYRHASASVPEEAVFFRDRAHILRREDGSWGADRILLQLAAEHAEQSPITEAAEKWLQEQRCDWNWLRRQDRPTEVVASPLRQVFDGHGSAVLGAELLEDGRILSWSADESVRLWNRTTGTVDHIFKIGRRLKQINRIETGSYLCITDGNSEVLDLTGCTSRIGSDAHVLSDGSILVCDRERMYFATETGVTAVPALFTERVSWFADCSKDLVVLVGSDGVLSVLDVLSRTIISSFASPSKVINLRLLDKTLIVLNCEDRKLLWDHVAGSVQELPDAPAATGDDVDELLAESLLVCGPRTRRYLVDLQQPRSLCLPDIWAVSEDHTLVACVENHTLRMLRWDTLQEVFSTTYVGINSLAFCTDFLVLNLGAEVHTLALAEWKPGPRFLFEYGVEVKCDPELLGYDMDESGYYMPELHVQTEARDTGVDAIKCIGNVVDFISDRHGCSKYDLGVYEPSDDDRWMVVDPAKGIEEAQGYVGIWLDGGGNWLFSGGSTGMTSNPAPRSRKASGHSLITDDFPELALAASANLSAPPEIRPCYQTVSVLNYAPETYKSIAATACKIPVLDDRCAGDLNFAEDVTYRSLGGALLAFCSHERKIVLYDEGTGAVAEIDTGLYGEVKGIAGDLKEVVTWGDDNVLRLWQVGTKAPPACSKAVQKTQMLSGMTNVTHFLEGASCYVTTSKSFSELYKGVITVFNRDTLIAERKIFHALPIEGARVLAEDRLAVWAGSDFSVYDLKTKKRLHHATTSRCHDAEIRSIERAPWYDDGLGPTMDEFIGDIIEGSYIESLTQEGGLLELKSRRNTYRYDLNTGSITLLETEPEPALLDLRWLERPDLVRGGFEWLERPKGEERRQLPAEPGATFKNAIGVEAGAGSGRWYADFEINCTNTGLLCTSPDGRIIVMVDAKGSSPYFRGYRSDPDRTFSILVLELLKGERRLPIVGTELRLVLPSGPEELPDRDEF